MLEFRHLKLHAPPGVYILPSFDSLREWSGVLFVRSGVYRGGIFRFRLVLPRSYPANGAPPQVLFQTRVFHPHVHPDTGQVDILSHFGGEWVAGEHYIVLVLQVLKSMMHVTSQKDLSLGMAPGLRRRKMEAKKSKRSSEAAASTNSVGAGREGQGDGGKDHVSTPEHDKSKRSIVLHPAALRLWEDVNGTGRLEYLKKAKACVAVSIANRFDNPEGSAIRFTAPAKQHESMMRNLSQTGSIRGNPFVMSPKILNASVPRRSAREPQRAPSVPDGSAGDTPKGE